MHGISRARLENNAGNLDYRRGRLDDAAAHYQLALDRRRAARGDRDPGVASWMVNLGNVQFAQRDHALALRTLGQARALADDTLPTEHPTRASILATIGVVHVDREQYAAAAGVLAEANAIFEATLGGGHPFLATTLLNQALADEGMGRFEAAASKYQRVVDILAETVGSAHPSYADALVSLARAQRRSNRLEEARRAATEARGLQQTVDATPPASLASCQFELAELDRLGGDLARAAAGYDVALQTYDQAPNADPRGPAAVLFAFAQLRRSQDRPEDAERLLRDAKTRLTALRGLQPQLLARIVAFERDARQDEAL